MFTFTNSVFRTTRSGSLCLAAMASIALSTGLLGVGSANAGPAPFDDTTIGVRPESFIGTQVPPKITITGFNCRIGVMGQGDPAKRIQLNVRLEGEVGMRPVGHGRVSNDGMIRDWIQADITPAPNSYGVAQVVSNGKVIATATVVNTGLC